MPNPTIMVSYYNKPQRKSIIILMVGALKMKRNEKDIKINRIISLSKCYDDTINKKKVFQLKRRKDTRFLYLRKIHCILKDISMWK